MTTTGIIGIYNLNKEVKVFSERNTIIEVGTFSPPGRKLRGLSNHDNCCGYAVTYEMVPKR